MALGAYEGEVARGGVLNALAHPTAVNPLGALNSAVQTARGVADLRTTQFNLQQAQLAPAYQAMRMLYATNQNPTNDDINAALGGAARIGGNVDGVVQNLADWTARGGKPADFVRAYSLGGMAPENQALMGVGTHFTRDTGAGFVSGITGGPLSAAPGVDQPRSFIAKGLTPGEATEFVTVTGQDGHQYLVPKGTLYGSPYGGGGGSQGGGGGTAQPAGPPPGSSVAPGTPLSQKDADLARFAQRESGNQNIFSSAPVPPGYTQAQGGSGYYQIIPSTWAEGQQLAGIPPNQRTQLAIQASPQQQYAVASALYDKYGGKPWAVSAPQGGTAVAAAPGGAQGGPFIGATSAQPVSGGAAVAAPGAGAGANVRPAGGVQTFSPTGQPIGAGGGGSQLPGVARGPGGAPILTPPAPWMGPLWEQSARQYSGDVEKEGGLASRIQPWQSALSILKANPSLATGPTSQQWNAWGSTLAQYGVQLPSMPGDSLTAYQELGKNLARGLLNSGAGSPTDMARLEAEASSPNINMVRDAIQQLAARQIGYERFQVARLLYFRAQHPGEDPDQYANQYRNQTSQWFSKLDPVAFGADNMSNEDIANYEKGLTPAQKANFRNSVTEAAKLFPDFAKAGQ